MVNFGRSSYKPFTFSSTKRNYVRAPTTNLFVHPSSAKLSAPWVTASISQYGTKSTNIPFFISWRNYCSNLEKNLTSDTTSKIEDSSVEGHQITLGSQRSRVDLELAGEKSQAQEADFGDELVRRQFKAKQDADKIIGEREDKEIPMSSQDNIDLELAQEESQAQGVDHLKEAFGLMNSIDNQLPGPEDSTFDPEEKEIVDTLQVDTQEPKENEQRAAAPKRKKKPNTPTLNKYGNDMNELAREGKFDPVAGRQSEIRRLIMILGRRRKNNPCLIGEPGVGKTAIIEGLAQRIVEENVPHFLQGKRVISIDMGLLLAGTMYCGMFEDRLTKIIAEAKQKKNAIILFIDEIHMLLGAGSHSKSDTDAADWLKPPLARGDIQCIGATTIEEYRKHIMKDAALERRFQPLKVHEPTVEETTEILQGLQRRYEEHHFVRFTDAALVSAAKLSHHYIRDRFLPDKAIDLIDEAASCVKLRNIEEKKFNAGKGGIQEVTEEDVQEALSCWTGIPKENVSVDESERLLRLEETLHASVVGQDEAVTAISRAIRRARAGIRNPHRPVASLIFSGPTGVGKTELAKALAACYYGSEDAMIRLDMSELMDRNSVSKLVGAPPGTDGYEEGGQLTEAVRRCPHSIVLFDEIEKAHSAVFDIMLQIMDAGRLTDAQGRTVDFKNTMLIMTSNIGGHTICQNPENDSNCDEEYQSWMQRVVMEELQKVFRPEFLNRVDETIVFQPLKLAEVTKIAEMMLNEVGERVIEKKKIAAMHVSERFKAKVVKEGYDQKYGARALRRAVMRLLENNLADKILAGKINEGDVVEVDVGHSGNVLINS